MTKINLNEKIRKINFDACQKASYFWLECTNERLSDVNKHLLSLSGIVLPLTASIVFTKTVIDKNIFLLLCCVWISLMISIFFGFIQFISDVRLFRSTHKYEAQRASIYSKIGKTEIEYKALLKELGEPPKSTRNIPLIIQGILLFISFILIIIIAILFSSKNIIDNHPLVFNKNILIN